MLTALRAQIELGDYNLASIDYQQVMAYTLPPRVAAVASVHTVTVHHQSLEGMSSDQAKQAFLNLIQSWPFYRASIFEVVVSASGRLGGSGGDATPQLPRRSARPV